MHPADFEHHVLLHLNAPIAKCDAKLNRRHFADVIEGGESEVETMDLYNCKYALVRWVKMGNK